MHRARFNVLITTCEKFESNQNWWIFTPWETRVKNRVSNFSPLTSSVSLSRSLSSSIKKGFSSLSFPVWIGNSEIAISFEGGTVSSPSKSETQSGSGHRVVKKTISVKAHPTSEYRLELSPISQALDSDLWLTRFRPMRTAIMNLVHLATRWNINDTFLGGYFCPIIAESMRKINGHIWIIYLFFSHKQKTGFSTISLITKGKKSLPRAGKNVTYACKMAAAQTQKLSEARGRKDKPLTHFCPTTSKNI